jgi:hypothetical protein
MPEGSSAASVAEMAVGRHPPERGDIRYAVLCRLNSAGVGLSQT